MREIAITFFAAILLASCDNSDQSKADPFLVGLPGLARSHEMPDGFVDTFTERYLAEVMPEISRIRAEVDPINQDPEIWNSRMMIYTNLWGEHGVDMHYVPHMSSADFDSLRSKMEELRLGIEERDIKIAELKARIRTLEGEQAGAR